MTRLLLLVAVAGCSSTIVSSYVPLREARPPRPVEAVDLRLSGPPSRPIIDLGLISIGESDVQLTGEPHLPQMMARLRTEGAAHGCDVVIGNPPQMASSRWIVTGTCAAYAP
jgi:hypothetical protein